ncbi:MAG: glutamyl-tRNA reductase [Gammaproteobacteria bacterium]
MSQVFSIGADFRTAPRALLDSIGVPAANVIGRLRQLLATRAVREAAIVSTCIRTEVYCVADGGEDARARVAGWLAGGGGNDDMTNGLFHLEDRAAVSRLFRIAGGLESQIIGETEIIGQIKKAAASAREAGSAGAVMSRLLDSSLAAAKAVRTATAIGRHSLSYPALAAQAATGIFGAFDDMSVLFVGAGQMTLTGAPLFARRGARKIAVAGRDLAKAQNIIAGYKNGEAFVIKDLPKRLAGFDVVISSTASSVPVIGKGAVESAVKARRKKPMMFADLASPRDLEGEIDAMDDVYVYDLAHFGRRAEASQQLRHLQLPAAAALTEKHVDAFYRWLHSRQNAPKAGELRRRAESTRQAETDAALGKLAAGEDPAKIIGALSRRLTGKLLHHAHTLNSGITDDGGEGGKTH